MIAGREGCLWSLLPARGGSCRCNCCVRRGWYQLSNKKAGERIQRSTRGEGLAVVRSPEHSTEVTSGLEENLINAVNGDKNLGTLKDSLHIN